MAGFVRLQCLEDVHVPAIARQTDDGGLGFEQGLNVRIVLDSVLREPDRAERSEPGMPEFQTVGAVEELAIPRIHGGPAAIDVVDSELVEACSDLELLVNGERDSCSLSGTVVESGIQYKDSHENS